MAYNDNTAKEAPHIETTKPADMFHAIADISAATVDLTTISGAGKHAAQIVRLNNATAAALTAVLVPQQRKAANGSAGTTTMSVVVNANSQYEPPIPIKAIIHTGSGALSALCFWWHANGLDVNP